MLGSSLLVSWGRQNSSQGTSRVLALQVVPDPLFLLNLFLYKMNVLFIKSFHILWLANYWISTFYAEVETSGRNLNVNKYADFKIIFSCHFHAFQVLKKIFICLLEGQKETGGLSSHALTHSPSATAAEAEAGSRGCHVRPLCERQEAHHWRSHSCLWRDQEAGVRMLSWGPNPAIPTCDTGVFIYTCPIRMSIRICTF